MVVQYTEPLDRTFHALGDASRRAMLGILANEGECTASELGEPFDFAQPTSSRHIKVLEQAGLVSRRVEGRVHRFRLETKVIKEAESWLVRHREFWEASFDSLTQYVKDLSKNRRQSK